MGVIDDSDLGLMCKVIVCGFPFLSRFAATYPNDAVHTQKHFQILQRFLNNDIHERFPNIDSFINKSHWILEYEKSNHTASQIADYTSCPLGDIGCAEAFALKRLIVGPFYPSHGGDFIQRLQGVDGEYAFKLTNISWIESPRFNAAIHFRNQFPHFERRVDVDDPQYQKKVESWLNGSECKAIFQMMREKLVEMFSIQSNRTSRQHTIVTVFVAADNEMVKHAFRSYLTSSRSIHFNTVYSSSDGIMHYGTCSKCRTEQVIRSLSYDWYLLSLSKVFLSWRNGGVLLTSTYLCSAAALAAGTRQDDLSLTKDPNSRYVLVGHAPHLHWNNMH